MVVTWIGKKIAFAAATHYGLKYVLYRGKQAPGEIKKKVTHKWAKKLDIPVPEQKKPPTVKERGMGFLKNLERIGNGQPEPEPEPVEVIPEPTLVNVSKVAAKQAADKAFSKAKQTDAGKRTMGVLKTLQAKAKVSAGK